MRILTFFLLIVSSLALRTAFNGRTRVHHGGLLSSACRRVLRMTTTVNPATVEYEAAKQQILSGLQQKAASGKTPPALVSMMTNFLDEYAASNLEANEPAESFKFNMGTFLKQIGVALENPYKFSAFHKAIREPFDYYKWGNGFIKPLVINDESKLFGIEIAQKIAQLAASGENIVILSNHQTEVDPQVLSILLEKNGMPELAEKIIFIAGHKVTTDPVAIPFSMGRNLICIHSKKHIKNPPEDIPRKQAENLESMKALGDLFTEGGRIFWVAPSGGRDRPGESGEFVVSPFDVKALDMFKLLAMQTKKPLHFFPMAMFTHQLVPPPDSVSGQVGESRSAKRGAISVTFLEETNGLGGLKDKEFTQDVQSKVEAAYAELVKFHKSFKK